MAKFSSRQPQKSGVPFGAIGAGSVELRPDGEFHEWQIANVERWSRDCRDILDADGGEKLSGSLSFYVRTKDAQDRVLLRRLGLGFGSGYGNEEYNYRMHSFNKPVEQVDFEGSFPTAQVEYIDRALPVQIKMQAVSPFVPYDERTSATPGFYVTFDVTNPSAQPVSVSLAGKLKNIVNLRRNAMMRVNAVSEEGGYTLVSMAADNSDGQPVSDTGSMTLAASGGEISYISGEYRGYMNEYIAHGQFGVSEESFLFRLQRHGNLPNTSIEERPKWSISEENADQLSANEIDSMLSEMEKNAYAKSLFERVLHVSPDQLQSESGKRAFFQYLALNWKHLDGLGPWGDSALCSSFALAPGETKQVKFVLSWYFPELCSASGNRVGHIYEDWFSGANEVNALLRNRRDPIIAAAVRFRDNLYRTDFPEVFSDAVSIHLSTLIKCAWWDKAGNFGLWEGLGSCGFHTTDITYHGSFGIVTLFPNLQKMQMQMGAKFQREDGRVHHFFTPDFGSVDDGFNRVDMNPQFVLLICRDYLATGDLDYLKSLWPNIVRAVENIAQLDADGDGLPDKDTKRNTYDSWNFAGTSAYISVLWVAALRAGAYLASVLGDAEHASRWKEWIGKGTAAIESRLWNGEYYNLWIDGDQKDTCCMTDQIDGEYFLRLIGLDGVLDEERVGKTLDAIYRYNYSSENGLVNARYPAGQAATLHTYLNCQAEANWSGIEYAMAAFYIMMERYGAGREIVETVDERYRRAGQIWNHAECGDHYYRPMSSWTLMQVLTGLTINLADQSLLIALRTGETAFHAPWHGASGYGQVERDQHGFRVRCGYGELPVRSVMLTGSGHSGVQSIRVNGHDVAFDVESAALRLREPVRIEAGDCLEIRFS